MSRSSLKRYTRTGGRGSAVRRLYQHTSWALIHSQRARGPNWAARLSVCVMLKRKISPSLFVNYSNILPLSISATSNRKHHISSDMGIANRIKKISLCLNVLGYCNWLWNNLLKGFLFYYCINGHENKLVLLYSNKSVNSYFHTVKATQIDGSILWLAFSDDLNI